MTKLTCECGYTYELLSNEIILKFCYHWIMKETALKEKAINMIEELSEDKLKSVIDYLKYLQGNYDSYDVNKNLKEAFYEVKLIKEGKIKTKTLKEFLSEL